MSESVIHERLTTWTRSQFDRITAKVYSEWKAVKTHHAELTQLAEDIWASKTGISTHTDSTSGELVSYGIVLLNEIDAVLNYGTRNYSLHVGGMFRINGRNPHSAECALGSTGLFAVLIWDMPPETTMASFEAQAISRLDEWSGHGLRRELEGKDA